MSGKTLIVLALVAFALIQLPNSNLNATASRATSVTLYAHAHPQGESGILPVLNAVQQWGPQQAARLQEGEAVFSLDPPLGRNITIDGTITIRLYVKSDFRLTGFLAVYLTANTPNGTSTLTHAVFNDTVNLDTRPHDFNYLIAINNLTLTVGATIVLHVKLTSQDKVTDVSLLYDSQSTPTQITLPIFDVTRATISFLRTDGTPTQIFEADPASQNVTVGMRMMIIDALGLYRLKTISLRISSSTGVVESQSDILPQTVPEGQYNATYEASLTLPTSIYALSLSITDQSGNVYDFGENFYITPYFPATIRVIDAGYRPIEGAFVVLSNPTGNYSSTVNETGYAAIRVPSSGIVGTYQLTVIWKNLTVSRSAQYIADKILLTIFVEAYDLTIRVRMLGFDLPGARIEVLAGSNVLCSGVSNSSGYVTCTKIPPGTYSINAYYLGDNHTVQLAISENNALALSLPFPHQELLPYFGIVAVAAVATGAMLRRRRFYRWPFEYFNLLTKDGIPDSRTTMIVGDSGSGKSVLMQSLAYQSLKSGRGCIYVTNVEVPSSVRTTAIMLGMDLTEYESEGKLIFIDCYSSLSGTASKEKRSLASITDLTGLGILITRSIEEIGRTTDVYLDALTPLFTSLKTDYVLTFIESIGAKVKSHNGGLCAILGKSAEKETMTRVEEVSDCVIETQLSESRTGQRRRLRVKKLRGHPYEDTWTRFTIANEGITFYTRKSPPAQGSPSA